MQIAARAGSPDQPGVGQGPGGSRVGDDWSFSLRNITDSVLIRAQAPQGWAMKSVVINGQDITDTPMEFPAGQTVSGMQIVLTKKVTSLTGQITDSRGNPVLDATIVVFPGDERLWTYQSRFIKAARPDQDGKFRVSGLPGPEQLPGGCPAGPRGRAGRRSRVSRDDQGSGDKSRTRRGRIEVG